MSLIAGYVNCSYLWCRCPCLVVKVLCKHPFSRSITFILYFVSLLLPSPSFCLFLDYSAHFRSLLFTSAFGLSYLRMFLTILVYVTFYLHTISDSRMFIVPILTWSIRNTVSVLWSLLVHRVATIHKNGRRLMLWRSWVWIPAPYTGWTFFTWIYGKNCNIFLKRWKKLIRGWECPFSKMIEISTRYRKSGKNDAEFGAVVWLSGRFRCQTSTVRIQSLAKVILNIVYCQLFWKDEVK